MSPWLTLELALSTMRKSSKVACLLLPSTVGWPVCPGSFMVDGEVHPGLGRREVSVWWLWLWVLFFLKHPALSSFLG